MTDLRAAAQHALEALETVFMPHHPAVISLRAALEQPEQEPLFVVEGGELRPLRPALLNEGDKLYTHPPRREAKQEQPGRPNECHWYQDGDEDSDKWAASCGRHRYFQLNDGTPTDNRMTHCCYCGKPLVEVPIEPENKHD
jgi:hypothetical protein